MGSNRKSMRNAFIRVSAVNNTSDNDTVVYTADAVQKIIDDWSSTFGFLYYYIEHPADDEITQTHWHILLRFPSPIDFDTVKNKFPFGNIENARNTKNCIQYMVHLNDASKKQYSWDDIKTNDKNTDWYKVQSVSSQEIALKVIVEKIVSGEIPQHKQAELIPADLWTKYNNRITKAFEYRTKLITSDKNRKINVVYFSGSTGTGKSTFAKLYCERMGLSYCESSSSNDVMQDYESQDVLILDDYRGDSDKSGKSRCVEFQDFLKMIDLNTRSSFKSRYRNKEFIGSLIIITSTRPIYDLYYDLGVEDKHQLFRRVNYQYQFTKEKIYVYKYDGVSKYLPEVTIPNPVHGMFQSSSATPLNLGTAFGITEAPVVELTEKDIIFDDPAGTWGSVSVDKVKKCSVE